MLFLKVGTTDSAVKNVLVIIKKRKERNEKMRKIDVNDGQRRRRTCSMRGAPGAPPAASVAPLPF